jgi:hypothetical protein
VELKDPRQGPPGNSELSIPGSENLHPLIFNEIQTAASLPNPSLITEPAKTADMIWVWEVFEALISFEAEHFILNLACAY